MKTLTIEEVRDQLPQLIDDVATGDIIIVSAQGDPVAKITGVADSENLPPGDPVRIARWLRDNPFPNHLRRTRQQIERDIAEERDAWD